MDACRHLADDTVDLGATNSTSSQPWSGSSLEVFITLRIACIFLICGAVGLVTSWSARRRMAVEDERRLRAAHLQAAADIAIQVQLGVAGFEVLPSHPQAKDGGDSKPVRYAVIQTVVTVKPAAPPNPSHYSRGTNGQPPSSSTTPQRRAVRGQAILKLRVLDRQGACGVCLEDAAEDIVSLGGCPHSTCATCAAKLSGLCPFCRSAMRTPQDYEVALQASVAAGVAAAERYQPIAGPPASSTVGPPPFVSLDIHTMLTQLGRLPPALASEARAAALGTSVVTFRMPQGQGGPSSPTSGPEITPASARVLPV